MDMYAVPVRIQALARHASLSFGARGNATRLSLESECRDRRDVLACVLACRPQIRYNRLA
jgi:hypothetical protein